MILDTRYYRISGKSSHFHNGVRLLLPVVESSDNKTFPRFFACTAKDAVRDIQYSKVINKEWIPILELMSVVLVVWFNPNYC
jgi:hypothetical protein